MRKLFAALTLSALVIAPVATAEKAVDVVIEYDTRLLATEDGAATILADIKRKARTVCKYQDSTSLYNTIDRSCFNAFVEDAVSQISAQAAANGQVATNVFASLETDTVSN